RIAGLQTSRSRPGVAELDTGMSALPQTDAPIGHTGPLTALSLMKHNLELPVTGAAHGNVCGASRPLLFSSQRPWANPTVGRSMRPPTFLVGFYQPENPTSTPSFTG